MNGKGFCVWLTGLSGSGKSTIAAALQAELRGLGHDVVMLDGDAVRSTMTTKLGYGRSDRDANVLGVAVRASQIVNDAAIAICALMSPYAEARQMARSVIGRDRFVLVHVATPLVICETRDVKGLYAKARRGEIQHVIGIDEEYEVPDDANLRLDTSTSSVETDVRTILELLIGQFDLGTRLV